jgi:hypothetical protein
VSTALKDVRIDLAWSCYDASNGPFKAARSGSARHLVCSFPSLEPLYLALIRLATLLRDSAAEAMLYAAELLQLSIIYRDCLLKTIIPLHDIPSILLELFLPCSNPILRQALPLPYP